MGEGYLFRIFRGTRKPFPLLYLLRSIQYEPIVPPGIIIKSELGYIKRNLGIFNNGIVTAWCVDTFLAQHSQLN